MTTTVDVYLYQTLCTGPMSLSLICLLVIRSWCRFPLFIPRSHAPSADHLIKKVVKITISQKHLKVANWCENIFSICFSTFVLNANRDFCLFSLFGSSIAKHHSKEKLVHISCLYSNLQIMFIHLFRWRDIWNSELFPSDKYEN